MRSTPNDPTFLFDGLPLHWQMTRCEKYAFEALLRHAAPKTAIEVGTYRGGSLQVIARHAEKVYSIDLERAFHDELEGRFPNVELLQGDSAELLPELLRRIERKGEDLGFVLIDGDHTSEGVRRDVECVLDHRPSRPVTVVFHDSFHPPCREGILQADWARSPHVHYVEIDFVPGVYHYEAFDTAQPRSMYGGLAVALLLPQERSETLKVHQSQRGLFDTLLPHSCHAPRSLPSRLAGWIKRRLKGPAE